MVQHAKRTFILIPEQTQMKKSSEEKIQVFATEQSALYIKVEELFALKKVQDIIEKARKVKVVGYKEIRIDNDFV